MYKYEISIDIIRELNAVSEEEIRAYANIQADTISIRNYDANGNSVDTRRPSMIEESRIIKNLIVGGIMAGRGNRTDGHYMPDTIRNAASTAEWAAQAFFNRDSGVYDMHVNCYDTVFCPIIQWFRERGAYPF